MCVCVGGGGGGGGGGGEGGSGGSLELTSETKLFHFHELGKINKTNPLWTTLFYCGTP